MDLYLPYYFVASPPSTIIDSFSPTPFKRNLRPSSLPSSYATARLIEFLEWRVASHMSFAVMLRKTIENNELRACDTNRHSPDDVQIRGNRTTVPPPRERHPCRSHRMAWFWRLALVRRAIARIFRHSDTPLLSLSPCRRFLRPTPERVFAAAHQSDPGYSGTVPSAPRPRPIGT